MGRLDANGETQAGEQKPVRKVLGMDLRSSGVLVSVPLLVVALCAVSTRGQSQEAQTEFAAIDEWLAANVPQWDEDQRLILQETLLGVMSDAGQNLSAAQQVDLLRFTPDFLARVGVSKGVSFELEIALLQEQYRSAIDDYMGRADVSPQDREVADQQREALFSTIESSVSRIAATNADAEFQQRLDDMLYRFMQTWETAAISPLSPYFKRPLAPSEFERMEQEIVDQTDDFLLSSSLGAIQDEQRTPVVGGLPPELVVLVRSFFAVDAFAAPKSERFREVESEIVAEAATLTKERSDAALAAMRLRRQRSEARDQQAVPPTENLSPLTEVRDRGRPARVAYSSPYMSTAPIAGSDASEDNERPQGATSRLTVRAVCIACAVAVALAIASARVVWLH